MPGVSGSEPFPKGKVPNEVTAHKHLATRKEEMPEVPSAYVPSGRTTVGGIVAVAIAIPVATVAAAIAAGLGSIVFSVGFRAFFWIMKVVLSMVRIVKTGETHTPATEAISNLIASIPAGLAAGFVAAFIVAAIGRFGKNRSGKAVSISAVVAVAMFALPAIIKTLGGTIPSFLQTMPGGQLLLVACMLIMGVVGCLCHIARQSTQSTPSRGVIFPTSQKVFAANPVSAHFLSFRSARNVDAALPR